VTLILEVCTGVFIYPTNIFEPLLVAEENCGLAMTLGLAMLDWKSKLYDID
jgi:hypothetical protein